jgi:hypothetical protein
VSFFEFVSDILWGASEIYLSRKDDKKNENRQQNSSGQEQPDRDEVARVIGNKTV